MRCILNKFLAVLVLGFLMVSVVDAGPLGRFFKRRENTPAPKTERVEPKKEEPKKEEPKVEPKKAEPKPKLQKEKTEVAQKAVAPKRKVAAPSLRD